MPQIQVPEQWWSSLFDEEYVKTYSDILSPEITKKEVDFIVQAIPLSPTMKILDLGCGFGRHTIELAKQGFQATGFDYSPEMIVIARRSAQNAGLEIQFVEGDMRGMAYESEYDVLLSLFSSFGYFSAEENKQVLESCLKALKPDGIFFLDILNKDWKLHQMETTGSLENDGWYTTRVDILSNGLSVTTEDFLNIEQSTLSAKRSWMEDGKERSYSSKTMIYNFSDIRTELEKIGFEILETWGGYKGAPLDDQHRRMLIKAQKKRAS